MERRIKAWKLIQAEQPRRVFRFNIEKSALMKQLRYRAVVQKTLSSP